MGTLEQEQIAYRFGLRGKKAVEVVRVPKKLSLGEETLVLHLKVDGIRFERQYQIDPNRKFKSDFFIPPNIVCEVDGGSHTHGRHGRHEGMTSDCEKQNLAVLKGLRPLRFTTEQVKAGTAIDTIRELLTK